MEKTTNQLKIEELFEIEDITLALEITDDDAIKMLAMQEEGQDIIDIYKPLMIAAIGLPEMVDAVSATEKLVIQDKQEKVAN